MPPRKLKPVSLAPVRLTDRQPRKYPRVDKTALDVAEEFQDERRKSKRQIAKAERALKAFRDKAGDRQSLGPTPERLLKAAGAARIEKFEESAEVAGSFNDGMVETVEVTLARVRLSDDGPITRLCARGQLAPEDKGLNAILGKAARRLRDEWARAGRETVQAIDTTRELVDGGPGLLAMESAIDASIHYRAALAVIPAGYRPFVVGVVIDQQAPRVVGRKITGYRNVNAAAAVCMWALQRGLLALAKDRYGLIQEDEENAEAEGVEA